MSSRAPSPSTPPAASRATTSTGSTRWARSRRRTGRTFSGSSAGPDRGPRRHGGPPTGCSRRRSPAPRTRRGRPPGWRHGCPPRRAGDLVGEPWQQNRRPSSSVPCRWTWAQRTERARGLSVAVRCVGTSRRADGPRSVGERRGRRGGTGGAATATTVTATVAAAPASSRAMAARPPVMRTACTDRRRNRCTAYSLDECGAPRGRGACRASARGAWSQRS